MSWKQSDTTHFFFPSKMTDFDMLKFHKGSKNIPQLN